MSGVLSSATLRTEPRPFVLRSAPALTHPGSSMPT